MASVLGVLFFSVSGVSAAELSTPTLVSPAHGAYTESQSPWITGLAPADTRVAVYIDNEFNGYAEVVATSDETLSFAYQPFLPLEHGEHTVKVRAENVEEGIRSKTTKAHTVVVEHTLPAPTVLGRVIDQDSSWTQPWIVGLAPAGTTVEIWIDGVFNGYATVSNDESGTGHFAYKPFLPLSAGLHEVETRTKATRTDETTRYSAVSEATNLWIVDPETVEESTDTTEAEETTESEESAEAGSDEESQEAPEESTPEAEVAGVATEETTEESSEEVITSDEAEESENSEKASEENETTEEGADESAEEEEASDDEESTTRTVVGWLLLVVAAIIVARQIGMRRRGQSTTATSSTNTTPLDMKTEDKNSNIEVISPAKGDDSSSSSENSDN